MTNAASRAQAIYNRVAQHPEGLTFDDIKDEMEGSGIHDAQVFDALAKLCRDGVIAHGEERPRRYRITGPAPNYRTEPS